MDRSMLSRATEGTEAPTPGYLYLDIAKNAASSPIACSEIAQYLTSRLNNKNNANIKYKCLKVISKTAVSPVTRGQFKRTLAQDSNAMAAIKEALQFRGPPDPARGDEPYQKVRTAAKEALDAIYSDAPTSMEHQPPQMQGIGSAGGYARTTGFQTNSNQIHQPPPTSGTGRRMEGIGNPMYQNHRMSSTPTTSNTGFDIGTMTIGEIAKEATATFTNMIKDPLARNVELPPKYENSSYGAPPGRHELAQSTGGQWTMASNRGPNSIGGSGYTGEPSHTGGGTQGGGYGGAGPGGGVGGSWGSVATVGPTRDRETTPQIGMVTSNTTGSGGIALTDGSFEKNMILELCPPGGMKAEPPPDKLARFAQAVPSLNADLICPALLDCLEEGNPWIIRAKALCVIETSIIVAEQHTPGNNPYAAFFYACRGEIEPLTVHARSAIQQPAQRILELMGISAGTAAAYPAAVVTAAPVYDKEPAADLLDFGADPVLPPIPSVAPPQAPPSPKTEGGLFGGLNLSNTAPPQTPSGSLFELGSISTVPASVIAADSLLEFSSIEANKGGLFGDLMVKAVPTLAAEPAAAQPNSDGLFGDMILNGVSVPVTEVTPAQSENSGLFGGMLTIDASTTAALPDTGGFLDDMVKDTVRTATKLSDFGAATAASGSAFGFINSSITPPAPPTNPMFDPLLSLTAQPSPTTAKAMMTNLGPEQLNAMYAQQNMLMMQQQMQQMQIMMMQQQKMGVGQQQIGGTSRMMQLPARGSNPNVMGSNANFAASSGFSFLDTSNPGEAKKKEDKSFDFVKDAMKSEKK